MYDKFAGAGLLHQRVCAFVVFLIARAGLRSVGLVTVATSPAASWRVRGPHCFAQRAWYQT